MDPDKKALADGLFRNVQMAHIRGVIEMHHAPSLEQTLENYRGGFQAYVASPGAGERQERTRRFMQAEAPAVADILAECYDSDKAKMIASLEARPDLLSRMPLITDFIGRGGSGSA